MHHVGGLTGVFRLVAVLVIALIALGLWKLHNAARTFLFILCVADIIGCLMALGEFKQTWHDIWANTAVYLSRQVLVPLPQARQISRGLPPPT